MVQPAGQKEQDAVDVQVKAFTGAGSMINSGKYDGQKSAKAKKAMVFDLSAAGQGELKVSIRVPTGGIKTGCEQLRPRVSNPSGRGFNSELI